MREILFRGKQENNEWAKGSLTIWRDGSCSIETGTLTEPMASVIPETVGQYTGLTDKNGKEIFEGDIILGLFLHSRPVNSIVSFQDGAFGLLWNRAGAETFWVFTSICNVEYEIIGNIHDNAELLEEGE